MVVGGRAVRWIQWAVVSWASWSAEALACPGNESCGVCAHDAEAPKSAEQDPAACAKRAELVGGACSYTTSAMASRVLSEGKPWAFEGHLEASGNALDSHVAAPFRVGPEGVHVVANQVLEALVGSGAHTARVILEGRRLEIDGVKYFVVTTFRRPST